VQVEDNQTEQADPPAPSRQARHHQHDQRFDEPHQRVGQQLAQQQLATVRSHSSYRKTFAMLLKEALEEMKGTEVTIHVEEFL
jgi:hypothetical protein